MITVKKIHIKEFRGIRDLEIDFKSKNFAICGRNGTGKSGVVDALEFALTGNISRLSGSGTGGISLKDHAPHVDSRNDPTKAQISLAIHIPSLKKDVLIERSVKDPSNPKVTPTSPDILKVLTEVSTHPEFALSRRELIKYVISAPGDRAKEVQALLRLDNVEELRTSLQKIANATKKEVPSLKKDKEEGQKQLLLALELTEFKAEKILEAVNIRRAVLGLPQITVMTATTSFRDGLTVAQAIGKPVIAKQQAVIDLKFLSKTMTEMSTPDISKTIADIVVKLDKLKVNASLLVGLVREQFLKSAIQLVTDDLCPVCDTPWDKEKLIQIVKEKLKEFDEASTARLEIEKDLAPLTDNLKVLVQSLFTIEEYGTLLLPKIDTTPIKEHMLVVNTQRTKLLAILPIDDTISVLNIYGQIPIEVLETIDEITKGINSLPDPTHQEAAKEYLIIAQERLEHYRSFSIKLKKAEDNMLLTTTVFDTYAKATTDFLNKIYKEVEKDFIDLYRYINSDDEATFTAELIPSIGKLGFHVDFYGRGYFPPGAYHSEGHQDGMGLCLYLALMKHLQGDAFTFAVLDDVLMSVDTGHRREVCNLLKEKFPNTQFILTTHDDVWLKHMKTAGLIPGGSSLNFRKWNVDHGPTEWSTKDVWDEIETEIIGGNIQGAAAILRHYLEFISADICDRLRARVEFRGDGQFQLGDLLPSATSQLNKLLAEGEQATRSWGKGPEADAIKKQKEDFNRLVTVSQLEQWQINPAIHYNQWMNLEESDFRPVVTAFKKLTESFICNQPGCGALFYTVPDRGAKEVLRCACGTLNINLKKK